MDNKPSLEDRYLTEKEAAAFLGISSAGLRKARCVGAMPNQREPLPFYRVGKRTVRYSLRELQDYMQRHRVEPRQWQDIERGDA